MVDVEPMLALIAVRAIVGSIVVVMMATLVVMIMVMATTDMTILVMLVDVKVHARERCGWRRVGHAEGGRQGKRERHRPNKGDAASACSFESRQHAILMPNHPATTTLTPLT